jgi:hypothetical protein
MTEAEKPQAMPTIDLTDDEHAALALTRTRDGLGGSGGAAGIGTGLAALGVVASRGNSGKGAAAHALTYCPPTT